MRLVTWNCRIGGFRRKAKQVAPLLPDVLAVQEVEPIDRELRFDGACQPTYRDRIGDPAYPKRAIGVFSYTDMKLKPVDLPDPMYCFRRYKARHGALTFQVVAVWTVATKARETSYKQAHVGLRCHADWIRHRPTVILGDFNDNASYRGGNWQQLLDLVQPLGLVSAYHQYFSEPFGAETQPTYFHQGKGTVAFHLDYCFVPDIWTQHIKKVEVGTFNDWHTISDHAPLIVDIDPQVSDPA
jgi:endonuclease/exonuclease/phosphatase family metal-dependent hydrolase